MELDVSAFACLAALTLVNGEQENISVKNISTEAISSLPTPNELKPHTN